MTSDEAMNSAFVDIASKGWSTLQHGDFEAGWNAALEWAKSGQEPVGWQFYDPDNKKWFNGMETNNHRKNTEDGGYKVRELYAHPAPAQPSVVQQLVEALEHSMHTLNATEQNYGNLWQLDETPESLDSLLDKIRAALAAYKESVK